MPAIGANFRENPGWKARLDDQEELAVFTHEFLVSGNPRVGSQFGECNDVCVGRIRPLELHGIRTARGIEDAPLHFDWRVVLELQIKKRRGSDHGYFAGLEIRHPDSRSVTLGCAERIPA